MHVVYFFGENKLKINLKIWLSMKQHRNSKKVGGKTNTFVM